MRCSEGAPSSEIREVRSRTVYNSRGQRSLEVEIVTEGGIGRACAPSGASVGRFEASSSPRGDREDPRGSYRACAREMIGADASDLSAISSIIKSADGTRDYSGIGGDAAYALSMACVDAAARGRGAPFFSVLTDSRNLRIPLPLGNILGGGAHAGPGTPDIQEILVAPTGAGSVREAVETNLAVHRELGRMLQERNPRFTRGRGDEGGWAPEADNCEALEVAAAACESLGYTLGREVSLGVDFASSTQWNGSSYAYERGGFENDPQEQIEFVSGIIRRYKLAYAEDAVHEEAFDEMAEITGRHPGVLVTGDDLTVTNAGRLRTAMERGSCNAAILKVNQAGGLWDAMEFAREADRGGISLVTSHRSGETVESQIVHVGVATGSKFLKVGVVGGERVAKLNEMIRLEDNELICGMAEVRKHA